MGNTTKYLSYKEAWERIKRAQKDQYFLEAVTIEESIISDRLISFLAGVGKMKLDSSDPSSMLRTPFSKLIKSWMLWAHEDTALSSNERDELLQLAEKVKAWSSQRNNVVHGLVKSEPGTPTQDVASFMTLAEQTANVGAGLAREICNWHKTQSVR